MRRIVTARPAADRAGERHLLQMRGKMFRPTLALLASERRWNAGAARVTLAAVVELMHLATLVHDDSVDHSVLRRGLPTVNSLFSHQVSRDHGRLPLLARARSARRARAISSCCACSRACRTQLTIGEMRQLAAVDALALHGGRLRVAHRSQDRVAVRARPARPGAMCGAPRHRAALTRFGDAARHGVPGRRRHPRLHRDGIRDREAGGARPSRAQGHAAADRRAAAAVPGGGAGSVEALFATEAPERRADRRGRRSRDRGRRHRRGAAPRRAVRTRGRRRRCAAFPTRRRAQRSPTPSLYVMDRRS